jgi:predicted PurR-regulated permease PerM
MYWLRGILNLLVSTLAFACAIGFIFSIVNRVFGRHFAVGGTEAPTEWQATLTFFIGVLVFFPLSYLLLKTDKPKYPKPKK